MSDWKIENLRFAAQEVADTLEAWAEAHERIARSSRTFDASNVRQAENYRALIGTLRNAIAESKS